MGQDAGVDLPMLAALQTINHRQRQLLCQRVVQQFGESLSGHTIALWGLAFKPGTDDLREAPSLVIIDELLRRGLCSRPTPMLTRRFIPPE